MTREKLNEVEVDQMSQLLESEALIFSESLQGKTKEELEKLEADIVQQMDDYDAYLCEVKYKLPESVTFDDKNYTRADVARKIVYFIGRMEADFRVTLGLYELCKIWKGDIKEVGYKIYDSTLSTLGTLKYRGYDEWKDILIIHNYMSLCHESYMKDLAWSIYLSTLHNSILDKLSPQPEQINENAE